MDDDDDDDNVDINRVWETIRANIKMSAKRCLDSYELKQLKLRFEKGC
jgi:hypothetical protein